MAKGDTQKTIESLTRHVNRLHEDKDRRGLILITILERGDLDGLPASTRYAYIKVAQYAQRILDEHYTEESADSELKRQLQQEIDRHGVINFTMRGIDCDRWRYSRHRSARTVNEFFVERSYHYRNAEGSVWVDVHWNDEEEDNA